MEYRELLTVALDFATAILLGALVGIEREKRKRKRRTPAISPACAPLFCWRCSGRPRGGCRKRCRTPWILAAALLIVGVVVVAGYFVTARSSQDGKGLTTEIAAVVVFLLGAMVMLGHEAHAIGLGVVTARCLPTSSRDATASWRSSAGTMSMPALRLLIATFIALPLLPDELDRSSAGAGYYRLMAITTRRATMRATSAVRRKPPRRRCRAARRLPPGSARAKRQLRLVPLGAQRYPVILLVPFRATGPRMSIAVGAGSASKSFPTPKTPSKRQCLSVTRQHPCEIVANRFRTVAKAGSFFGGLASKSEPKANASCGAQRFGQFAHRRCRRKAAFVIAGRNDGAGWIVRRAGSSRRGSVMARA